MHIRLIVFAVSIAMVSAVLPRQQLRDLCSSVSACGKCLSIPDCYGRWENGFGCKGYPLPRPINGSYVIERPECCPDSPQFSKEKCGFNPELYGNPSWIWDDYMLLGGITCAVILLVVVATILGIILKRKWARVHVYEIVESPPPPVRHRPLPEIPVTEENYPSDRNGIRQASRNPSGRPTNVQISPPKRLSLAELVNRDISAAAAADWERRRSLLRDHPLEQAGPVAESSI